MNWTVRPVQKVTALDLALCLQVNRACAIVPLRRTFALVSWLGNGKVWYALMLLLPVLFGREGLAVSLHMAVAGIAGVLVYKAVKRLTHRPRPYQRHHTILLGAAPLDQFSFPSGHTLHAVLFTLIVVPAFPVLAWVLLPFMLLVAASRVILGLHYPTDVLLGAAAGATLAMLIPPIPLV